VIGFNRNAWSDSAETGGRIQPKRVIAFTRNPHIGYVDAQLLAATRLTPGASLWTGERRLTAVATRLGVAFEPEPHH
jgi:hypothetical protein